MVLLLLYRFVTFLAAPFVALALLLRGDGFRTVGHRLGFVPSKARATLWFHAASVGEFRALQPLIEMDWDRDVVVTLQSRQGLAVARQDLAPHFAVLPAPLDAPFTTSAFVHRMKPAALVLVESELWPGWMATLNSRRIPAVLLDGAVSETSARRWGQLTGLAHPIGDALAQVTTSSQAKKRALDAVGFGPATLALPLKLAGEALPVDASLHRQWVEWRGTAPLVILANAHRSEIDALKALIGDVDPAAKFIIAPRHPDQINAFQRAFGAADEQLAYWTSFGTLGSLYALGGTVVMGGGFDDEIGSHNPLEALRAGCAVVRGPHAGKQADVITLLEQHGMITVAPGWPKTTADIEELDQLARTALQQARWAIETVL